MSSDCNNAEIAQADADASMVDAPAPSRKRVLLELALLYARLGITAFGGPAAHIAMMEEEVVRRRSWLTREQFLDLFGVVNLIPGPSSTQMAIQIGYRVAGWPGLAVGGICFILPAALLTLFVAWLYVHYGTLPQAAAALYGVKAVMVAVVFQAIWSLSRSAVKTAFLALLGVLAALADVFQVNILLVLFGAGIVAFVAESKFKLWRTKAWGFAPLISPAGAVGTAAPLGLLPLFLFFLKVGAILFGSGYVLLAFLRADLVLRLHWLTDRQLLDAIAAGQVTPGPVFTTATFIGYLLGRVPGAIVATVGIFLPSFVFIAIVGPMVPRLRKSAGFGAFLNGVNAGALALMAVVLWQLGRAAVIDLPSGAIALVSGIVLFRFKVNTTWLILGGAIAGLLAHRGLG